MATAKMVPTIINIPVDFDTVVNIRKHRTAITGKTIAKMLYRKLAVNALLSDAAKPT